MLMPYEDLQIDRTGSVVNIIYTNKKMPILGRYNSYVPVLLTIIIFFLIIE